MFRRRLLLLLSSALLSACNPGKRPPVDPAPLQTPAAEAALRHLISIFPARADAKLAVIGIGEIMSEARPEFVEKFKDVQGLQFLPHNRVVAGMAGGKSRRFDQQSGVPVLELQISELTEAKDGVQQAVAAWAFKDDAMRYQLEIKAKPGGGFDVKELKQIPVRPINDDRRDAGEKK